MSLHSTTPEVLARGPREIERDASNPFEAIIMLTNAKRYCERRAAAQHYVGDWRDWNEASIVIESLRMLRIVTVKL